MQIKLVVVAVVVVVVVVVARGKLSENSLRWLERFFLNC